MTIDKCTQILLTPHPQIIKTSQTPSPSISRIKETRERERAKSMDNHFPP
jgi:hypothetical protein